MPEFELRFEAIFNGCLAVLGRILRPKWNQADPSPDPRIQVRIQGPLHGNPVEPYFEIRVEPSGSKGGSKAFCMDFLQIHVAARAFIIILIKSPGIRIQATKAASRKDFRILRGVRVWWKAVFNECSWV